MTWEQLRALLKKMEKAMSECAETLHNAQQYSPAYNAALAGLETWKAAIAMIKNAATIRRVA